MLFNGIHKLSLHRDDMSSTTFSSVMTKRTSADSESRAKAAETFPVAKCENEPLLSGKDRGIGSKGDSPQRFPRISMMREQTTLQSTVLIPLNRSRLKNLLREY
jgi:hypothetical protein